jgi:hypothetical protein
LFNVRNSLHVSGNSLTHSQLPHFRSATGFQSEIYNDTMSQLMKASTFCFSTILAAASLFTSTAFAVTYSVRSDSGTQCYSLEVPGGITPDPNALVDPDVAYSKLTKVNPGSAEVAAVGWAGGILDHEMGIGVSSYPNSLTNLGSKTPGGYYNASYVHPKSVQRVEGPTPYYLVEMTGVIAGEHQTLYAAVLDDGRLVRPEVVPCVEEHHRPMRHHGKWGGAETKKWGGKHP